MRFVNTKWIAGARWCLVGGVALSLAACAGTQAGRSRNKVHVITGEEATIAQDPPAPALRVNQVGYAPSLEKLAVLASDAKSPLDWQLLDGAGKAVASGKTQPLPLDADSGESLHLIDFSSFKGEGKGFKLSVGKEQSPAFDVRKDLYAALRYDALSYFYQNRSGIAIEEAYVPNKKLARPAAHLSDKETPCAPNTGCDYSLDASGGWYDAGDHGKYVVNGGISVWTLLNLWERSDAFGSTAGLGDGKLRLPEHGNSVPDLLDEVRWELEFMLRMQVPEGKPLAGMVHHKMHDDKWTGIGQVPPADTKSNGVNRYLRPPSTAATLNLAAVAAQAARVYAKVDPAFAERCLKAAKTAWEAAKAHPDKLAPEGDNMGGGPYDDSRVSDEFSWAATELYLTTGEATYAEAMKSSPFFQKIPAGVNTDGTGWNSPMTWQSVSALGTISLAVAKGKAKPEEIAGARKELQRVGDSLLADAAATGYRFPFKSFKSEFPWGSNSFVANNALVLALVHDFTKDAKYLDGAEEGMDYLLGRNPMGRSYVTGFGSNPSKNPHHRFWAHQEAEVFPEAPPGCLVGGPNSGLQDPIVDEAKLKGCAPERCYLDHNGAWSVNEITINWNAPLAWLAYVLDEQIEH